MAIKNICIIGAGIAGCSMARLLAEQGHHIQVFEKLPFIGGNCFDHYDEHGVLVHKFGPHIFHTNYEDVWAFMNNFSAFNSYVNTVLVWIEKHDLLVPFPINLTSIKQLFPDDYDAFVSDIIEAKVIDTEISIAELIQVTKNPVSHKILNFIYENVYANYTAKMWGTDISDVDPNVIKRVKLNLNDTWNYFPSDKYCGLPTTGYNQLLTKMLDHPGIKVKLNHTPEFRFDVDYIVVNNIHFDKVIYTGSIDGLLNYRLGTLPYRSLEIVFEHHNKPNFQNVGVINYPSDIHMTRICEYKYLTQQDVEGTTISREYPNNYNKDAEKWNEPSYPINNENNIALYNAYVESLKPYKNLVLCGRLAEYKYYDMDDIVKSCIELSKKIG